jgi:hypothetical protein
LKNEAKQKSHFCFAWLIKSRMDFINTLLGRGSRAGPTACQRKQLAVYQAIASEHGADRQQGNRDPQFDEDVSTRRPHLVRHQITPLHAGAIQFKFSSAKQWR